MLRKISLLTLLASSAMSVPPALAAERGLFLPPICWPDCVRPRCCDDYCPKPWPCVRRVACFGCDDYQSKCPPCVRRVSCLGCDDYCPTCPPVIRCAPVTDLRCVPQRPCPCPADRQHAAGCPCSTE